MNNRKYSIHNLVDDKLHLEIHLSPNLEGLNLYTARKNSDKNGENASCIDPISNVVLMRVLRQGRGEKSGQISGKKWI